VGFGSVVPAVRRLPMESNVRESWSTTS
jgi:hypothetical protein